MAMTTGDVPLALRQGRKASASQQSKTPKPAPKPKSSKGK